MSKTYARLTEEERYQIYEDKWMGLSHRKIVQKMGRHHSTISREITRNTGLRGYRPRQAHQLAHQRHLTKPKHIKMTADHQALITRYIEKDWSPEQVQGRLKRENLPVVCTSTIYAFIRTDKAAGGELYKHLRHPKPYKKRTGKPLDRVTDDEISMIQDKLNNRPRKTLGFKTPNEVYDEMKLAS